MKKNLRKFGAVLTAGIMTFSAAVSVMASDIVIVQNTNIDVQQNINKNNIEKENKAYETEETIIDKSDDINKNTDEDYISDSNFNGENQEEDTTDYTEDDTAIADEDNENDFSKDYPKNETDVIEEDTNAETDEITKDSSSNININNTNDIEIIGNTGTIHINIYNGIDVDIDNKDGQEADVNVFSGNEIEVNSNDMPNTPLETQESETIEEIETETIEETIETTTEAVKITSRGSSSGGRRSSKGKSSVLNTPKESDEKEEKPAENKEAKTEKEKKVVCMTIGSNLMNINGEITETDSAPYISNNYTLVPLRCISTVFDAEVDWDNSTKTAIITADAAETRFVINSDTMFVNGVAMAIPKSAEITGGRTYVPLRALGEALGANVSWIPDSKSVLIIK